MNGLVARRMLLFTLLGLLALPGCKGPKKQGPQGPYLGRFRLLNGHKTKAITDLRIEVQKAMAGPWIDETTSLIPNYLPPTHPETFWFPNDASVFDKVWGIRVSVKLMGDAAWRTMTVDQTQLGADQKLDEVYVFVAHSETVTLITLYQSGATFIVKYDEHP